MPDVLAIHWERRRLRVVEASIGSNVRVNQAFAVEIPETPSPGWLRDALRKNNVTAKQTIIGISREDAILRQLELPNAPDDEIPALVRFQASTRSTTPLDQLLLDFLPLPARPGVEFKDVLLASVTRAALEPIRAALAEAGLDLVCLTLSSFALAEFAVRVESSRHQSNTRRSLVILEDSNRLEVVLLGQQQALAAHMVRAPLDDAGHPIVAKAAADVSRVLVPAQPWLANEHIERIWIVGNSTEWQGLDQALAQRWNCGVEQIDSKSRISIPDLDATKLDGNLDQFATALGLALGRLHPQSPSFDLLHPRQPKPKLDPRKLQLAAGSAAALVLLAICTSYIQLTMLSLQKNIAKAKAKESELAAQLKKGEPTLAAASAIGEWATHDVNQIRQFSELNEIMQGTSRLYISDYNFSTATGDVIAKLLAGGNAKDRIDAPQVAQRLVDSQHFRVKPRESKQPSRDSEYPHHFELDTELIRPNKNPAVASETSSRKEK